MESIKRWRWQRKKISELEDRKRRIFHCKEHRKKALSKIKESLGTCGIIKKALDINNRSHQKSREKIGSKKYLKE